LGKYCFFQLLAARQRLDNRNLHWAQFSTVSHYFDTWSSYGMQIRLNLAAAGALGFASSLLRMKFGQLSFFHEFQLSSRFSICCTTYNSQPLINTYMNRYYFSRNAFSWLSVRSKIVTKRLYRRKIIRNTSCLRYLLPIDAIYSSLI